ncbi:hypothetical protein [Sporosarcina sp. D27]|uniref:hypothetical protein n=1 Tax=Sporosarcina sp. D27 TaxID=1382305 RepID=UPI000472C5B0|nr:hypothetical protein [Sporosarcina sp. D27]
MRWATPWNIGIGKINREIGNMRGSIGSIGRRIGKMENTIGNISELIGIETQFNDVNVLIGDASLV